MNQISTETSSQRHKVKFHGSGDTFFGIWLVNGLLTILTLGIYSAWAKVRTHRYFYGNTELAGDRFDYHAKPTQILLGRILVILGVIVFYICMFLSPVLAVILAAGFGLLLPWIIVRNWRFEAIMSSYRGVRFNYRVRTGRAYMVFFVWPVVIYIALFVLLGICYSLIAAGAAVGLVSGILFVLLLPGFIAINGILSAMTHDLYVNNMFFGNSEFKGEMKKAAFVKFGLISAVLAIPFLLLIGSTLGSLIQDIIMLSQMGADDDAIAGVVAANFGKIFFVYFLILVWSMFARAYITVAHRNYLFNQTSLSEGKIKFHSTMKLMPYVWLLFVNGLIIFFSGGLGTPFARVRHARYVTETLEVEGDLDAMTVNAHAETAQSAVAEELVQAMDINVGI